MSNEPLRLNFLVVLEVICIHGVLAIKQINRLPPEVVKYFTDPNAIDPPDMELLFPFVESALPLAYGVLGVQLFHVREISTIFINLVKLNS